MKQAKAQIEVLPLREMLSRCCPAPQRVLVVRSGPHSMLELAVGALRDLSPEVRITVLCHPDQETAGLENVVYPYASYFRADRVDLDGLRGRDFDLAILLYATDRRLHPEYHEVDEIARRAGAGRLVALYWDNLAAELTPGVLSHKLRTEVTPWLERKERALAEITAFSGEDTETAEDKCNLAAQRGNEEWRNARPVTDKEIDSFYRGSDFYIYALTKECDWRGARSGLADTVAHHLAPGDRVLDYGGGVGTLSIELSGRSFDLSHLDLPGKLLQFAASRFKARGLPVRVIEADSPLPLEAHYEAIVCTHVLEHLTDPEQALRHMAAHLVSGGHMFLAVPFDPNPVGGAHPAMHLNRLTPESYARATREQGLELFERAGELDIFRKTGI